jgi:hypothetical protein
MLGAALARAPRLFLPTAPIGALLLNLLAVSMHKRLTACSPFQK